MIISAVCFWPLGGSLFFASTASKEAFQGTSALLGMRCDIHRLANTVLFI
jgi:hypothetical protein